VHEEGEAHGEPQDEKGKIRTSANVVHGSLVE
jgi:hypothetical protein